ELLHEHLMGNQGFQGQSSLLYHLRPPTALKAVEPMAPIHLEEAEPSTPRPRHLRTSGLPKGGSPTLDRQPLLFNEDVALWSVRPDRQDEHFYRNAIADELVYVAEGEGELESPFGTLSITAGDQLVLHRGIVHRYRLKSGKPARLLIVESRSYLRFPDRYRSELGQLLEGAPFSERDIQRPGKLVTHDEPGDHAVVVRQERALTRMVMAHHPCDVVGWDGYYYPWAFNIHDFEPITGTIHQPPPIHQILQGDSHVVCNFCPRPYDFHPDAVPAPYNHSNVMTDEVLYYASSEFMSRKGIEFGSITLHPDGLPHGPQPGRYEASIGQERTEELAVMIDAFRPLRVTKEAAAVEDVDYLRSWID
ncbi:MAG: homogentisate 1,2-dioxygenase, partial [Deltaproteobacteria bacterium]|nr:homogentisate 1,2-dioxygenase [Deltaproteobacteria bacterium]